MRRSPLLLILPFLAWASAAEAAITKGPWVQRVTPTSAVVRFELDVAAPATVKLGADGPMRDAGAGVFESKTPTTLHSVTLTGLEPATRYAYEVTTPGGSTLAAVTTAPKPDSSSPFRFLIYGDNRTDEAAHAAVVRGMAAVQGDFLLHTGDFVENGGSRTQWQTFFDVEAPLLRERPIFSCVGNHELIDGSGIEYIKYFGPTDITLPTTDGGAAKLPEHLDGTFRWGNARFFLLNGMVGWRSGADRAWLDKALSESDSEPGLVWRIVVTHFGPWSSGPHGNNQAFHDAGFPAIFRQHKVDLVVSGHDHIYERGWAEGLAYLVSGGGGAPVYRIKNAQPFAKKYESVRHFVEASVSQAAINFTATRPDGSVIERCALRKELGWDCDAPAKSAEPTSNAASSSTTTSSTSSSSDAPSSSTRCGCRVVGRRACASDRAMLFASLGALAAIYWRRRRHAMMGACDTRSSF